MEYFDLDDFGMAYTDELSGYEEPSDIAERIAFDKQFKAFYNPDISSNSWYDTEYVPRYANNPAIQEFLQKKEGLLSRRGKYIEEEAVKGNIKPYLQHQKWLNKQNVLPSDAKPLFSYQKQFFEDYGFSDPDKGVTPGLGLHDLYAHAIPEKFLGYVDKSLPGRITAADEARAELIERLANSQAVDGEVYSSAGASDFINKVRSGSSSENPLQNYLPSRKEKLFTDYLPYNDDLANERQALAEEYLANAVSKGFKNLEYGTNLDIERDPIVSDLPQNLEDTGKKQQNIVERVQEGAASRFPTLNKDKIANFLENQILPYVRDVEVSNKLNLSPSIINKAKLSKPELGREFLNSTLFSLDPVTSAALGASELSKGIRQTPASLLPGVSDLIPSPEAIRTGYKQGPVAMGKQMAKEFVQSLPTAAAAAGVLSTPLAAPLAPGIGAGLVGTAGARALNEVVRQETGEGIVPKLRQAIGTAPRTGFASPASTKPRPLVAQVKPLTSEQKAEMTRQQNRNELQRRIELAQQRFNPRKLEFGLSELLRGR